MSTYLGQNFLKDSSMRTYIADMVEKQYSQLNAQALIEIGPWKWAITKKICKLSSDFFVVEKDLEMKPFLLSLWLSEDALCFSDILEVDLQAELKRRNKLPSETLVVWNLPYYITSPIFRLLFAKEKPDFLWGIFMIQYEVGEKIITTARKKSYLWWLLNWWYEVSFLKTVPAKCFSPAPKVKSCLVQFTKKHEPVPVNFLRLQSFLDFYAPYSRKTLGRIMKMNEKKSQDFNFFIPEHFQHKRLEELTRDEVILILGKYAA